MPDINKYLIIQLACFGDCLYATTIAKQLKHDDPDCHITWAIASKYASVLDLNPHIDDLWVVENCNGDFYGARLKEIITQAKDKIRDGIFNDLIICQIPSFNWHRYNGSIRGTILAAYPRPISVDINPVIRLSSQETSRVEAIVKGWNLSSYHNVLLFECSPKSGQSPVTPELALEISEIVVTARNDICIILSSPYQVKNKSLHVKDASLLSIRENAELANYCTHLIGCSSGITWLCTSDWTTNKLPTIQYLNVDCDFFAGVEYDLKCWNKDSSHVIEIKDFSVDIAVKSILCLVDEGVSLCKERFHQQLRPNIRHFNVAATSICRYGQSKWQLAQLINVFWKNNKHIPLYRVIIAAGQVWFKCSIIVIFLKKRLKKVAALRMPVP